MARKKKPYIKVETLPNGYALTVGKQEYLCFSPTQLVESIFIHIGIGLTEYMNRETMTDLMTACATWPDAKDALKMLKTIQGENSNQKRSIENLKRVNERLEERIALLETLKPKPVKVEIPKKPRKPRKPSATYVRKDELDANPVPMYKRRIKPKL